jgi:thiosulfate reductase cytochrome b subunit
MPQGDFEDDTMSDVGDSMAPADVASAAASSTMSSRGSARSYSNKRREGSVAGVDIQKQQNLVTAVTGGAFYHEKRREAWIMGMSVAFFMFIGFAIGGFFFYKNKIISVIDTAVKGKVSDAARKKLEEDVGSFDAVQMLWYLGWGIFSFLIGYVVYFTSTYRWRNRQITMSKQSVAS